MSGLNFERSCLRPTRRRLSPCFVEQSPSPEINFRRRTLPLEKTKLINNFDQFRVLLIRSSSSLASWRLIGGPTIHHSSSLRERGGRLSELPADTHFR